MTTPTTPEQARELAETTPMSSWGHNAIDALRSLSDQLDEALKDRVTLAMQAEVLTAERDSIKQQAQIWKMEASAHKRTVQECYQACTGSTGEPGNWNGANPVRALVAERDSLRADAERLDTLDRLGYAYGFEDMHEGNRWVIEGPFKSVRDAIDDAKTNAPKPPATICGNCDTALPGGCGGQFADDGEHCRFGKAAS